MTELTKELLLERKAYWLEQYHAVSGHIAEIDDLIATLDENE